MFAVYFDESGTHDGSAVYTVAGYIATVEQWTHFEREWIELLKQLELWPDTAFHMADIECPHHHVFGAWDRIKKHNAIARALGIVKRRVQYGFSTSVNKEEYEGLIFDPLPKAGFKSTDGAHTAYSFCLANCLKQLSSWADYHGYTEPVSYFFESGAGVGNDINSLMANIKTDRELRQRFRYHVWSFKDKQDTPQLQAADMNAYESHKHWVNTLHSKPRRVPRYTFESLMEIPQKGDYLGKEDIAGIIKQTCVYVPPGVELPPGARGVVVKP